MVEDTAGGLEIVGVDGVVAPLDECCLGGKGTQFGGRSAFEIHLRIKYGNASGHWSDSHTAAPEPINTTGICAGLLSAAKAVGH